MISDSLGTRPSLAGLRVSEAVGDIVDVGEAEAVQCWRVRGKVLFVGTLAIFVVHDGIHQRLEEQGTLVAAFMSAHSKTPYITPSMHLPSWNGVVPNT